MLMKIVSFILAGVLLTGTAPAFAGASNDKKQTRQETKLKKHGEKIRKAIVKLGASEKSIVEVRLRDKSKVTGYISEINNDSFTVIDESGSAVVIEYPNAKQIKGNNIGKGAWIVIGFGAAMAVFGIAILYAISKN